MTQSSDKMTSYNNSRKEAVNNKRASVLLHAEKLFLEKGITMVSMNDIASTSGISRATMYRYFENKEAIVFTLASRMMQLIYGVAFKDVSFDSSRSIAQGYKNMVSNYSSLSHTYRYMAMFDGIYTNSDNFKKSGHIYVSQFKSFILPHLNSLSEKDLNRHIMTINLTMDFLEDLALHEELIPITQGITIQCLLDEFYGVIDAIVKA